MSNLEKKSLYLSIGALTVSILSFYSSWYGNREGDTVSAISRFNDISISYMRLFDLRLEASSLLRGSDMKLFRLPESKIKQHYQESIGEDRRSILTLEDIREIKIKLASALNELDRPSLENINGDILFENEMLLHILRRTKNRHEKLDLMIKDVEESGEIFLGQCKSSK